MVLGSLAAHDSKCYLHPEEDHRLKPYPKLAQNFQFAINPKQAHCLGMNILAARAHEAPAPPSAMAKMENSQHQSDFEKLAVQFRAMQLFAHNAHNLTAGPNFFADHAFLGDLYGTYESAYDSIVERAIGQHDTPDLVGVQKNAAAKVPDSLDHFRELQMMEVALTAMLEMAIKNETSQGCINLLAGMADDSEVRQYKLGQRLGF